MFLTVLTSFASSKNVSAMYFALSGSPGINTMLDMSSTLASLCGVINLPPLKFDNCI